MQMVSLKNQTAVTTWANLQMLRNFVLASIPKAKHPFSQHPQQEKGASRFIVGAAPGNARSLQ